MEKLVGKVVGVCSSNLGLQKKQKKSHKTEKNIKVTCGKIIFSLSP